MASINRFVRGERRAPRTVIEHYWVRVFDTEEQDWKFIRCPRSVTRLTEVWVGWKWVPVDEFERRYTHYQRAWIRFEQRGILPTEDRHLMANATKEMTSR